MKDVAKLLEVDESTVRRLSDSGELPCWRTPGGHRRFSADEVQKYLAKTYPDLPGITFK